MPADPSDSRLLNRLEILATEIFHSLSRRFPVCMASDEFHYFPQFKPDNSDGSRWDDFSPESVEEMTEKIAHWVQSISGIKGCDPTSAQRADCEMLCRVLSTLREQLTDVGFHKTQPTFYLTIAGIGLAEAMEVSDDAFARRIDAIPGFIDDAIGNLDCIPELYRNMGREMIPEMTSWLTSLRIADTLLSPAIKALERLDLHLRRIRIADDFRLPQELYARIAHHHMGCGMTLDDITRCLDHEINENRSILEDGAMTLAPGTSWQEVVKKLPPPAPHPEGIRGLYRDTIMQLRRHCIDHRFCSRDLAAACPATVETIPAYLFPVRSNAAFSMPPGHPPRGGIFYIMPEKIESRIPRDFRLLTAHETYPGHHLLDTSRWMLDRAVRRPVEFPLFYEGWASFSEEILFETGFFSGNLDEMLLARRRFLRAVRGRVDLDIHTGRCSLGQAAAQLADSGLIPADAARMVRRYALKPGYQLSYTIGSQNFRRLYRAFTGLGHTPSDFVSRIMNEGEIGFEHLADILKTGKKKIPNIDSAPS